MSQNIDFVDMRSGQCCDLNIIRQTENFEMPFIPKARMGACYLSQDIHIPVIRLLGDEQAGANRCA